jgi:phage shock protein PspC (stress-responsive transcriptional regulator)
MPSRERSRTDDDRLQGEPGADDDFELPEHSPLRDRPVAEQPLFDEPIGSGSYESVFGLDEVTEDDVALFLAEQDEEERKAEKKAGFLNLQTGAGLGLIGVGTLYLMQLAGLAPLVFDPGFISMLPVLAGILIVLTGFGVINQNRSKKRKQRKKAAARKKKAMQQAARAQKLARKQERSSGRRSRTRPLGSTPGASAAEERVTAREARRRERITTTRTESRTATTSTKRRKRLAKSAHDRKLFGVAGGLGQFFNIDPTLIRIAFVIGTIFSGGTAVPLYLLLALVLPNETKADVQARLDDLDRRIFKDD